MAGGPGDGLDPFGQWKTMRDSYMDAWSKAMIDFTSSAEYAKAQASMLDAYLAVSAPFQGALEKAMTDTLTRLNMPTRGDITSLAERLTNIEIRLDDLDARLDGIESKLQVPKAPSRPAGKMEK